MWPGRSVVMPNVIMFHDDIGAGQILFFLINKNGKFFCLVLKNIYFLRQPSLG
jgi:hypothetical protein